MLGHVRSGINSLAGLSSHRSAADIVKMHHRQFLTQHANSVHAGSYVVTTEADAKTVTDRASARCEQAVDQGRCGGPPIWSKRKMNIIDDTEILSQPLSRSENADTDIEEESALMTQARSNLAVDETLAVSRAPHHFEEELSHRKTALLKFLELQNAEALRAIQQENSTFIQQHGHHQFPSRDTSYFSADLRNDLCTLEQLPLSECHTTAIVERPPNVGERGAPHFINEHE